MGFIIILALVLRIIGINQSLWLDEGISALAAKSLSFWDIVTKYPISDFHPPGYFILLWGWGRVFGWSELSLRFPSVIFGIMTVGLVYLIGKELFGKRVGLIASLFLALSPLHVYYSQEARMYSFAAFSVALSYYFLIELLKGRKYSFFYYSLSLGLVFYSDYVAYLAIIPHIITVWLIYSGKLKDLIKGGLIGLLLLLPWLFIFPSQLLNGISLASSVTRWRNAVGQLSVNSIPLLIAKFTVGRISFENKYLYIGVVSGYSLIFLYSLKKILKRLDASKWLVVLWLGVPIFAGMIVSLFVPLFSYFRFLYLLPALFLLLALGLEKSKVFIVAIITAEVVFNIIFISTPKFQREDWRGAVSFVEGNKNSQTQILFKDMNPFSPYAYYATNLSNTMGAFRKIPVTTEKDIKDFEPLSRIYMFEYLTDVTDPQKLLDKRIKELGFKNTQTYDFNGVGFVYLFER